MHTEDVSRIYWIVLIDGSDYANKKIDATIEVDGAEVIAPALSVKEYFSSNHIGNSPADCPWPQHHGPRMHIGALFYSLPYLANDKFWRGRPKVSKGLQRRDEIISINDPITRVIHNDC